MNISDIIIIGAGTAGLTAGIYAARAKKQTLIIEKNAPGGQILETLKVENYPGIDSISGADFGKTLKSQVEKFGGKILTAEVLSVSREDAVTFRVETDEGPYFAKSLIFANGSRERRLDVPGEENYIGRGVSYCATCDGALYKDKTVAVYGGGNTAAYSVLYLAEIAKKVYWCFRKSASRAESELVEKIKHQPNVEILSETEIIELCGEGKLEEVVTSSVQIAERVSTPLVFKTDALFVSIGREPDNEIARNLVNLDADGFIDSDETCTTSEKGVFVAGDARRKPLNQLVTSAADGAVAASAAIKFLNQ
ncbi:FAD-dependent oxidoreductase [Candidatus Saccharibacteria bacterium]|nr:FAD-dependent oxidoreductase [Candidatus Saccharibacteria bacterium]